MKIKILITGFVCLLLIGCAGVVRDDIRLIDCKRPEEVKEKYGGQRILSMREKEYKYIFEDDMVRILWLPTVSKITFYIANKTQQSIYMLWDEMAYIDESGEIHKAMYPGDKPLAPTEIVRRREFWEIMPDTEYGFWADYLKFTNAGKASYSSLAPYELDYQGWTKGSLSLPFRTQEEVEKYLGNTIHVILPFRIEDVKHDYVFTFELNGDKLKNMDQDEMSGNGRGIIFGGGFKKDQRKNAVFLNKKALSVLRTEGNIEEAIRILNLAYQADKTAYFVSYNLGKLYIGKGDLKKAKEFALRAISYKNDYIKAHDLLGNICFKQGKYEDALREYKKVTEISEADVQAHYNLGIVYWVLKDLENAETEWRKVIEYESSKAIKGERKFFQEGFSSSLTVLGESFTYSALLSLGSLYETKAQIEDAIGEYETAVELDPYNPSAYFELGRIYVKQKSWEKARFYLEKHIDLGGRYQERANQLLNSLKSKSF